MKLVRVLSILTIIGTQICGGHCFASLDSSVESTGIDSRIDADESIERGPDSKLERATRPTAHQKLRAKLVQKLRQKSNQKSRMKRAKRALVRPHILKPDFSRGWDVSAIKPMTSLRDFTNDDIGLIIPVRDLTPTSDTDQVATKILDHSLTNFFNSPTIKNSSIGRTANQVEKSMEAGVAIGGDEPEDIKHNFKFAMKAAQSKAQLEYTGLTNAQLSYQIAGEKMDLEVREPLKAFNTDLVYNHINTREDRRDLLSMRWNW